VTDTYNQTAGMCGQHGKPKEIHSNFQNALPRVVFQGGAGVTPVIPTDLGDVMKVEGWGTFQDYPELTMEDHEKMINAGKIAENVKHTMLKRNLSQIVREAWRAEFTEPWGSSEIKLARLCRRIDEGEKQ